MRFSPSTLGWYPEHTNYPDAPDDLIAVSDDLWQSLRGKQIEAGPGGVPREVASFVPDKRQALRAAVTAKRWEVETGGIVVGGVPIRTGADDQARITSVIATAGFAGVTTVRFKNAGDEFVELSIAEVQGIAAAIGLHVQACFDAEAAHYAAINMLPEQDLDGYDTDAGWPQ